ncbi:diacylglycerol/lipid kinase family protein [Nocardiopsis coralliicola]
MLVITGEGAGGTGGDRVDAVARALGPAARVRPCGDAGALEAALDEVADDGTVVVAGGDGSLHAVVGALHRRGELAGRTVGLVPMGTGNDFARSLGLPADPVAAAEALSGYAPRPLDLIEDDTGAIVVNAVHLGAGADSTLAAENLKAAIGAAGYPAGSLLAGLRSRGHRMRVAADGQTVLKDRRVLMAAVANGRFIGGGAEVSPRSRLDDGRIDLVVSRALSFRRRARYALSLAVGRHIAHPDVRHISARVITIRTEPANVSADGEVDRGVRHRTWRVLPGAWSVLAPPAG